MKRLSLFFPVVMAAGCLDGGVAPATTDMSASSGDMASTEDPFTGGTITLPAPCGYVVNTFDGASRPMMGSAMLGASPTPWAIHLGIAGDPATTMVVSWRTTDESTLATTVQYGVGDMTDQSTNGLTFSYALPSTSPRMHETHICGLKPSTVYSYRVGGKDAAGKEAWSPVYKFHTAPLATDTMAQVTIGVIGDTRLGEDVWGEMLGKLQATAMPDVIFFSGDAVLIGNDQTEWEKWWKAAEPVLRLVPLLSAHGNHDNNSVNYYSQFALPGDEQNYGLDYGSFHLTVVNDSPVVPNMFASATNFLGTDLTAHDAAPWKFLLHHQPMYSSSTSHGSNVNLRDTLGWGAIVDKHKVDMVFNGHDHDYERSKPMRAGQPQVKPTDGTTYVVAGSAGAELYPNGTQSFTAFSKSDYNFAVVQVRVGSLTLKAYDRAGDNIDSLTITKP